jgi:hypothetical protein
MNLREELIAYQKRWALVEKKIQEERQNTPIELRWKQLNAAYTMGKGMGLTQSKLNEAGVFEIWTRLKTLMMKN